MSSYQPRTTADHTDWVATAFRWESVSAPMQFPVENRPVYVVPCADLIRAKMDTELPKMAKAVSAVCDQYPDDRVLVHTVAYKIGAYLHDHCTIGQRAVRYGRSEDRAQAIRDFERKPAAVMFAPSLDRGWDGADDLARVIIVAKVPYPNLGDPQIAARLHTKSGQMWYAVETVRTIVQMTGRGVRSRDDWAHSFILDSQFRKTYNRYPRLFPAWWKEAVSSIPPFQI